MKRIVELKEKGYADKDQFADAPVCYEDAIENYKRVLDITGDVAANIIEPNSESVDLEGPHLVDGRMVYASKTVENIDRLARIDHRRGAAFQIDRLAVRLDDVGKIARNVQPAALCSLSHLRSRLRRRQTDRWSA